MKRTYTSSVVLVAVTMVALASCGAPTAGPGPGGANGGALDGAWRLTEGAAPGGSIPTGPDHAITLGINGGEGGGIAACNHYGARIEVDGSAFRAEPAEMTEMACEPRVMRAEALYIEALAAVDEIESHTSDELVLSGGGARLAFELVPPPPTAALVGTDWELVSLLEGRGNEGIASSAEPAELRFDDDGTFSGTTGCRTFSGSWREGDGAILVLEFGLEGDPEACTEMQAGQDDHIAGAIGDGFTAEIEGRSLTLYARSGPLGLAYQAP